MWTRGGQGLGRDRATAQGDRLAFWSDKMFWNLREVMAAQLCENTKSYQIVHFFLFFCCSEGTL
jgi:hypothetical protein